MSTGTTAQPVTYGRDASIAKFSVAKYQRMVEEGILTAEDKVELLENYVVLKMPRNPPHDGTIELIDDLIRPYVPKEWRVRAQLALTLPDSQPEPDFTIVRGPGRNRLTQHPTVADLGVVIEVADSSLLRDQRDKTRIYARAGVPIYWIVNLVDRRIEVYTQPSGPTADPAYAADQNYLAGDSIPLVLDGTTVATIPVADLLP
jgi:Uma2 family endonuclease